MSVLEVRGLHIGLRRPEPTVLVSDISLAIAAGGCLGLTGQSGSGKSLTGCALSGLLPPPLAVLAGEVRLMGQPLDLGDAKALRGRRGREVFLMFQSPAGSLDPSARIGPQIAEALRQVRGLDRRQAKQAVRELLARVGLEPERARAYPFELSGGQRQRVLLAIAFGLRPRLLIADEPTTGLDQAKQEQILALLRELRVSQGTALCLISHDLRVLAAMAQDLAVLHRGRLVESGPLDRVLAAPQHWHTQELVRAKEYLEARP
ncbi:MAG: ABC transporter ATP-binding protein [Desulfarculaceae bacterium]|nr:ABC transporter ATP-binding protein [Desulfarculaceae bacterium]